MSAFLKLKINTEFTDSDSDSLDSSTPRKDLLRIQTGLDLRSNTPSPPPIERRSTPTRTIKKKIKLRIMHKFYSPRPESVIKLIQTPSNYIKNNNLKLQIEKEVKNTIDEIISTVESNTIDKIYFENSVHLSSENLKARNLYI
jgi:hypothetical protein